MREEDASARRVRPKRSAASCARSSRKLIDVLELVSEYSFTWAVLARKAFKGLDRSDGDVLRFGRTWVREPLGAGVATRWRVEIAGSRARVAVEMRARTVGTERPTAGAAQRRMAGRDRSVCAQLCSLTVARAAHGARV